MAVARHGRGPQATVDAVASQIHPVFMVPPVAAAWFGAMLAMEFSLRTGIIHSLAIFAAVYTAHVKDGYIDFHIRGEDDDLPLTPWGCRVCLAGSTGLFFLCLGGLWIVADWIAVVLTFPGWVIGYFHAPQLDMNPIGVTLGYPTGISLAILGGYYVQTETLAPIAFGFAVVFIILLAGVKTIDDAQDVSYDRSIGKPTIAAQFGDRSARILASVLFALALSLVVLFAIVEFFPRATILASVVFAPIGVIALKSDPRTGTALLIRGAYLFLAVLLAAVWFRPFG